MTALLVYMPFHIFLSQSLSLITGGLSIWKVAKDVILCGLIILALALVCKERAIKPVLKKLVMLSVVYGVIHLLVWAINPHIYRQTAFEGVVYNNRVLLYAVFACAALVLHTPADAGRKLVKLTLVVSTLVCLLGLLQYVLPKDLPTHFGYSVARGVKPNFFIDDKLDFPRIMSTLRDPNSLGAYTILPLCLLYGMFVGASKDRRRQLSIAALAALHATALFLTFSRGAWAGAIVAFVAAAWLMRPGKLVITKQASVVLACAVVVLSGAAFALRHQHTVENVLLHSDQTTKAPQDSNGLHASFAIKSLKKAIQKPLGHGPGTAGIVSIRNPEGGQLTENYYIQLLYEVGFLGLAVFVTAAVFICNQLRKSDSLLARGLLASFIAYSVMGMLMHIWSNEAVAAQWWLLAGACLALSSLPKPATLADRNTRRPVVHQKRVNLSRR